MPRELRTLVLMLLLGPMAQFLGDGCGQGNHSTDATQDDTVTGASFQIHVQEGGCGGGGGGGGGGVVQDELPPYEAYQWRYLQVFPGDPIESAFYQVGFDDSQWSVGQAAFGTAGGCLLGANIHTQWLLNSEMLLRHYFTLATSAPLFVYLAIDNNARVYINGNLIGDVVGGECAELDEYVFGVPSGMVMAGTNVVAVAAVDEGIAAYADLRISKTGPCGVAPANLDFSTVPIGGSKDLAFTITNTTQSILTGEVSVACSDYSIMSGGGPFSLGAGLSMAVTVRFSPSADGQQTCIVETGTSLCLDVTCQGFGVDCQPLADPVKTFNDDFEDASFSDWTTFCGEWAISAPGGGFGGGRAVVSIGDRVNSELIHSTFAESFGRYHYDVYQPGGIADGDLHIQRNGVTFYWFMIAAAPADNVDDRIIYMNGTSSTILGCVPVHLPIGWNQIDIFRFPSGLIQVFAGSGSCLLMQAVDTTLMGPGGIAIRAHSSGVKFDNVWFSPDLPPTPPNPSVQPCGVGPGPPCN